MINECKLIGVLRIRATANKEKFHGISAGPLLDEQAIVAFEHTEDVVTSSRFVRNVCYFH